MRKQLLVLFLFIGLSASFAQQSWSIDKSHSSVKFGVTHLVISTVEGSFKDFDAALSTKADGSIEMFNANIKTASIYTESDKRDEHLRSDDFFGASKNPEITFISKKVEKKGKSSYKVTGDLTIKGVTKSVVLSVNSNGKVKDPWGNIKSGYTATGKINRFDFGLTWSAATEAGGLVVGKDVNITINAEFTANAQTSSK